MSTKSLAMESMLRRVYGELTRDTELTKERRQALSSEIVTVCHDPEETGHPFRGMVLHPVVVAFCLKMQDKITNKTTGKPLLTLDVQYLLDQLRKEVEVLQNTIDSGEDLEAVQSKSADVGNFAMMVADYCTVLEESTTEEFDEWLKKHIAEGGCYYSD